MSNFKKVKVFEVGVTMRIAVCDDNKLHLMDLKEKLSALPIVDKASYFTDLSLFLASLEDGHSYEAVLMDIDWGQKKTGMDAATELYKHLPETPVIYVSGYSEKYAQHIFLHQANLSGFISKPVDAEILEANLEKVAAAHPYGESPSLIVRQGGTIHAIPFCEISVIESWKHNVTVHYGEESLTLYEQLGKISATLPPEFHQCHKSYVVNMRHIQRFQSSQILLKNGRTVPVSRSRYQQAKETYLNYIGETI
jgi:DNA-binding LytR/AlgR family response regulator